MAASKEKRFERGAGFPLVLMADLGLDVARIAIEYARAWDWDLRALWISGFEWPTDKPVSGALIGDLAANSTTKRILDNDISVVRLGRLPHPDDARVPTVLPDKPAQGRLALEHFQQRGFRHVGLIGFHPDRKEANNHSMFTAFRERADELGMHCHLLRLGAVADSEGSGQRRARENAMISWLSGLPKPVGVFAFADFVAVQAFMACSKAGLFVPEEVALLGCGNSITSQLASIPISSVDPASEQCVSTALRLLHGLMGGEPAPRKPILVPPDGIVVRTSTDVLAVPDRAISQALRFIWNHFEKNISIQDIADAAGLPRRSLERGFRTHLNRSVHDELRRKRVTELRHLLLTTHEPIADLAPRAGFFTLTNANRCFRKAYGISPGKYRAQHGGAGRVTRSS